MVLLREPYRLSEVCLVPLCCELNVMLPPLSNRPTCLYESHCSEIAEFIKSMFSVFFGISGKWFGTWVLSMMVLFTLKWPGYLLARGFRKLTHCYLLDETEVGSHGELMAVCFRKCKF